MRRLNSPVGMHDSRNDALKSLLRSVMKMTAGRECGLLHAGGSTTESVGGTILLILRQEEMNELSIGEDGHLLVEGHSLHL